MTPFTFMNNHKVIDYITLSKFKRNNIIMNMRLMHCPKCDGELETLYSFPCCHQCKTVVQRQNYSCKPLNELCERMIAKRGLVIKSKLSVEESKPWYEFNKFYSWVESMPKDTIWFSGCDSHFEAMYVFLMACKRIDQIWPN